MPKLTPAQMKKAVEEFKKKFTPGFYHGSPNPNIEAFDPLKSTVRDVDFVTPGVTFVTKSPKFADSFTAGKGPYISLKTGDAIPLGSYNKGSTMYPVSVDMSNHFDPMSPEGRALVEAYVAKKYAEDPKMARQFKSRIEDPHSNWTTMESPAFLQHLRDSGVKTFNVNESGYQNVGVLDPSKIRGKFAKYDPEEAESPEFMKAEGGPVQHFQFGGLAKLGNPALKLAKEISPKFSLEAIQNMPVSSAQKQLPVARAFQMLSSENVDPKVKQQIFKQYLQTHPDLVRKSGATNYDELTQAAYQQMAKETADQFQALQGSGVKLSFDPTGERAYKSSKEMLEDALQNKQLTVFQGGEPHPALNKEANEQFRAVHDYFGHGTTGASFGPKGEELAYGAHSQMYSPLARLAAATETRGQNSLVSYSGMNEELINAMNQLKAQREQLMKSGGDPSAINDQLVKLGQQFKYAPQKPLILPPEQIDINYPGFNVGGAIKKGLEHARSLPFVHFSNAPSISQLDPRMYGKGIKGAEADRLKEALDIKPRSYFYVDKPGVKPEQGLGPHKYQGTAEGIYPLDQDPLGLSAIAKQKSLDPYLMSQGIQQVDEKQQLNELERLIKQAGYKGYANDDVGLLFYPTPVKKAVEGKAGGGKVGALEALVKKILPAAEREANKAKFLQGTKVVDYNGKPITMYHHTTDFKGDAFNPALAQKHDQGYHGQGMYFGADDYLKRSAFGKHSSGNVYGEKGFIEGSQIMPVHLSIKNPKYVDVTEQSLHGMPIEQLKEMGYDGVIVTRDDSFKNVMGRTVPRQKIYNAVAFEPTQIKSATGNTGTFDPLDPNITKAGGGSVFNPEGAGYDYQTAMAYGMGPTGTGEDLGHWGSVAPTSDDERMLRDLPRDAYVMLKGKAHETFDKAEAAEKERGSKVVKIGDRYYSIPK